MNIRGKNIVIRTKKPADAEHDYQWSVDPELSALDAVAPCTMTYHAFYHDYIHWLRHPYEGRVTFGVDTPEGKHIANCVYYNIDDISQETEIGIMIGDRDYWNRGYGADIMSTLIDYCFQILKFKRVYLKTLQDNFRAQKCFENCGMTVCGRREMEGYKFLIMDLTLPRWQELKKQKQTP
jgi:RimJ/RimL family protein N-acetyltransferase